MIPTVYKCFQCGRDRVCIFDEPEPCGCNGKFMAELVSWMVDDFRHGRTVPNQTLNRERRREFFARQEAQ